jgi:hypothetical protein
MNASIQNILAQIDSLDEAAREELQAELRLRAWKRWEQIAEVERERSVAEGITEADIDRAVEEVRYGVKTP